MLRLLKSFQVPRTLRKVLWTSLHSNHLYYFKLPPILLSKHMLSVASGLLKQHIRPIVSLLRPSCPASSYSIPLSPQVFPFSKLKLQGGTIICRRGNGSALLPPCPYACSPVPYLCRSFPGRLWLLHHPRACCPSGSLQRRLRVSPPHGPSKLICHCAYWVSATANLLNNSRRLPRSLSPFFRTSDFKDISSRSPRY